MIATSPVFTAPKPEDEAAGVGAATASVLQDRLWSQLFLILVPVVCFLQLALFLWLQKLAPAPPEPVAVTFMAAVITAYGAYRLAPLWKRIRQAEEHSSAWLVEETLAAARDQGAVVFGDLPGQKTRHVDHVVVAPTGVYVVNVQSPLKGDSAHRRVQLVCAGGSEQLVVGGLPVFDDPGFLLTEAATGLGATIKARCGECHEVRPVVVFPGGQVAPVPPRAPYAVMSDEDFHREVCLGPDIIEPPSVARIGRELAKARDRR